MTHQPIPSMETSLCQAVIKLSLSCHQEVNQLSEISKLPSGKAFFRTDEEENVEMMRVVIFKMSINVNTHSLDLTATVPLNKIV